MLKPMCRLTRGFLAMTLLLVFSITGCSPQPSSTAPPSPATKETTSTPANQSTPTTATAAYGSKSAAQKTTWTQEEMLQYAIEDEYMARAEYKYVLSAFGDQNPFANIVASEETHIDYLENLYNARNMTVPADNSGQYLVKPNTVKDALSLGVEAEIANISMYQKFLDTSNLPADMKTVFEQLKAGSENHLSAFRNRLSRL